MKRHRILTTIAALAVLAGTAHAQPAYPPPPYGALVPPPGTAPPGPAVALYAPGQLDQMLAPVALYPDPLLTSILTAATYPVEVDAAAQWLQNPGAAALSGDALAAAMQGTDWDPSVKSLVPFPQVLAMMDQQLAWTQALGNAFLAQQPDVMVSIQRLRRAALTAGTLVSTQYAAVSDDGTYISITPAQPQTVYVPVYNPGAVYGAWPYPQYQPDYFGPPPGLAANYVVGALGFSIGIGVVDLLWNWGDWDWRDHDVRVDPARYNRINAGRPPIAAAVWQHDPDHRRGAPYVDPSSRQRFQAPMPGSAAQRQQFRFGAPPQQAALPTPERRAPALAAPAPPAQPHRPMEPARPVASIPTAPPPRAPTAFDAVVRGPQAQSEAQRGQQSRQTLAAPPPRSAPAPHPAPAPVRAAAPAPSRPAAVAPARPAAPAQRQQQQQPQQPGERRQ